MRLYGLIGYPLGHSFSQRYFTDKFETEGITDCRYLNFPLESIQDVERMLAENPDLQGFNVTIPYKQAIIPYLNGLSPEAEAIGAVNCVKVTPLGLIGYNTDVDGFGRSLQNMLGGEQPGRALVLGTGGASRAVKHALRQSGIPFSVVSRRPESGQYTYEDLTPTIMAAHRLIVNATPLGTFPNIDDCPPIPYNTIKPDHYLFDLVYNPPLSEFLHRGETQGASIMNGYEMLVGQAEKAWEIWNTPETD